MSQRKEHLQFISALGLGEICWLWCGLNLKVLCQSPACVLSCPLPTAPCSALYFRELHSPGSPAPGWWLGVLSGKHLLEMEFGKHSWLSSCSPPCLLHGSNNCQTHPLSGGPRSWSPGIRVSFQFREGKGFLLMLNLGLSPLPPFGIFTLQYSSKKLPVSNPLCLKSLARILLDSLDPQTHGRQPAPGGEERHRLWPGREGRFRRQI